MGTLQSCASLSLTFEWVQCHAVSWAVPHSLWHFSALKSNSGGKWTWPPPLSLAPPRPAWAWLQLFLSPRDSGRWSCCWALGYCQGDFSSSGIHVQTCHCLDGLSKLGSSWEFSWEVSPSLHRLIPSHTSVENGLVYDTTSNEIELSFINWANVFSWLLPVVLYVQCYFPL